METKSHQFEHFQFFSKKLMHVLNMIFFIKFGNIALQEVLNNEITQSNGEFQLSFNVFINVNTNFSFQ